MDRRGFVGGTVAACALAACGGVEAVAGGGAWKSPRADAVDLSPEQWKKHLNANEFHILREAGTERAFTGDLWSHKADGVYVCAGCGLPLFDSATKFRSGTGWPSFYQPLAEDRVADRRDTQYGMIRTENVCARCGGHLGHVFSDGPKPTGLRYCINSASLDFVPRDQVSAVAGEPVKLGGIDLEVK